MYEKALFQLELLESCDDRGGRLSELVQSKYRCAALIAGHVRSIHLLGGSTGFASTPCLSKCAPPHRVRGTCPSLPARMLGCRALGMPPADGQKLSGLAHSWSHCSRSVFFAMHS
jgi:hypothetical protein